MSVVRMKIGELLVKKGLLRQEDLDQAVALCAKSGARRWASVVLALAGGLSESDTYQHGG